MIGNLLAVTQEELDSLYENPESISEILYETHQDDVVDLDKSWQVIHFMLTGFPYEGMPPLCHAIFGQEPIGEEDVGYGPALGTSSKVVSAISDALSKISEDEFCKMFNPESIAKADIYPQIWSEDGILEEYIVPKFRELKSFYAEAAANNHAVITFIN